MNNGALDRSQSAAPPAAPAAREDGRRASRCAPHARRHPAIRRTSHAGHHLATVAEPPATPAPIRVSAPTPVDEEDAERERDPSTDPALLEDRTMETYQAMEEKDAAAWERQNRRR